MGWSPQRSHRHSPRGSPRGHYLHPAVPPPSSSGGWSPQRSHRGAGPERPGSAPPSRPRSIEGFAGHAPRQPAPMSLKDQQRTTCGLLSSARQRQFDLDALSIVPPSSRELGHRHREELQASAGAGERTDHEVLADQGSGRRGSESHDGCRVAGQERRQVVLRGSRSRTTPQVGRVCRVTRGAWCRCPLDCIRLQPSAT